MSRNAVNPKITFENKTWTNSAIHELYCIVIANCIWTETNFFGSKKRLFAMA